MARGAVAASAVFLGFLVLLVLFPSKKQLSLDGGGEAGLSVVHADAPADSAADSAAADSAITGDGAGGGGGDGTDGAGSDGAL